MNKIYLLFVGLALFLLSCSKDDEDAVPDFVPTITIETTSVVEGGTISLLAVLDSTSLEPVSFEYLTENKTATAGDDYEGVSETVTVTIAPGEKIAMIRIASLNDAEAEEDEAFAVKFSNPVNGKLAQEEIIVTLKNKAEDKPGDPVGETTEYYMEATMGTKKWEAVTTGSLRASVNSSMYTLAGFGRGVNSDSQISLKADEMFEVGKYKIEKFSGPGAVGFSYSPTFFSSSMMGVIYSGVEGELNVEKVDLINNVASGTFFCKTTDGEGNFIEFSDGKFKLPIE